MKKKTLLVLTTIIIVTAISIIPASAEKPAIVFSATGTLDEYYDIDSAEIVGGEWSVQIVGTKVEFEASYLELNLDEEVENSPEGSIDKFDLKFVNIGFWFIDGDTLTVVGVMRVKKEWKTFDGKTKTVIWFTGQGIEVTPTGIRMAREPTLGPGDKFGTTTSYYLA